LESPLSSFSSQLFFSKLLPEYRIRVLLKWEGSPFDLLLVFGDVSKALFLSGLSDVAPGQITPCSGTVSATLKFRVLKAVDSPLVDDLFPLYCLPSL